MKRSLLLATILISLLSSSYQSDVKKYVDCIKTEGISSLTEMVLEAKLENLQFSSSLSKIGLTLLYASNCQKDLGPALMILDNVISNIENIKSQWKQALVSTFTFGLVGLQSSKDCVSAYESIKDLWTKTQ